MSGLADSGECPYFRGLKMTEDLFGDLESSRLGARSQSLQSVESGGGEVLAEMLR